MKRSYPSETEKIRDKKECGQTPQVLFLLFTQTPQLLVNTVSVPAAPIPGTSFSSLPSTAPENNSVPMHRTILRRGHDPLLSIERCSVCCNMFHCDYCKMLHKHLHEAKNHVANHFRNAVQQEGFVIIKCGLGCRQAPHFHCCYCKSTLIRRDALIKHLTACKNTSHKQPPPKVPALPSPPPPSTAEVPPSQVEEPPSQVEEPPSQVEEPPSQVEEPPSQVEEPPSQVEEPSSQVEEPPSQLPPSPAERPSPTAEDPLSPAEKLPSPPERSPSTAERPPSTAERPPSPPERPPSPPERPPSTAEDPPTPAEGPPSATAASAAMHRTILRRGHDPLLSIERCSVCCNMFHCDYCKMLHKHLHQAQNHVANHVRNAVQHEGFVIIKCGLGCRQAPHFHCCYCKSTLIRKDALIKHLVLCKNTSDVQSPPTVSAAAPPPPPSTAEVPPSLVERPPSQVEEPSSQVPPFPVKVPPFPSAVRLRVRQQVRVACPHCGIQINKKNLMVHIKRRHRHNTLL